MLKDMFVFAVRNIKSYRKFFIQIVLILSLILCLCSIYVCSITSIYDSYDDIQSLNYQYNYVEVDDDIAIEIKEMPVDPNEQWMKYDCQISKRTKYAPSKGGLFNYKQMNSNFSLTLDGKVYNSITSETIDIIVEGTDIKHKMITENESISFKGEFGKNKDIIIKGSEIKNDDEIIISESIIEMYNLDINSVIGKQISFSDNDYSTNSFKIVGVISKDYVANTVYLSDNNDYFSSFKNCFKTITRIYFKNYDEAEIAYSQFFAKYKNNIVTYAAEDMSSSITTLQNMLNFIQIIFIIFIVILGGSFLVTLALKVDSIIYLQKTFLGVLISHGFERRKVDMLLWVQVIICGFVSSIVAAITGTIFVLCSKGIFEGLGVNVVLNFGVFITSLGIIFVLMLLILFVICAPMFIKLRKNDIIDYLR